MFFNSTKIIPEITKKEMEFLKCYFTTPPTPQKNNNKKEDDNEKKSYFSSLRVLGYFTF